MKEARNGERHKLLRAPVSNGTEFSCRCGEWRMRCRTFWCKGDQRVRDGYDTHLAAITNSSTNRS